MENQFPEKIIDGVIHRHNTPLPADGYVFSSTLFDIITGRKTILIVSDVNICLLKYATNDQAIATMLMVFHLDMNRYIS